MTTEPRHEATKKRYNKRQRSGAMPGTRVRRAPKRMTMRELVPLLGKVANVKTPTRALPLPLLYALAAVQELYARVSGRPVLLSLATVRLMVKEAGRTHFNHIKSERELAMKFRPLEQTVADTVNWYRNNGWC